MKYEIFDAHCDTALKLYFDGKSLYDSDCMVSAEKCGNYKKATYTMAIFNDKSLKCADIFAIIEKIKTETRALKHTNFDTVIAVEGLGNTPDLTLADVEKLAKSDVRIMSLTWNDDTPLCGGVGYPKGEGAEGNTKGLTALGKEYLKEFEKNGIILDTSHISDKGFYDVLENFGGKVCATHSNSRAVCSYKRNLTDDMFIKLKDRGGVAGINLCPDFLNDTGIASSDDAVRHIEHFMALGGEDNIGIGADFDGIDSTPSDIPDCGFLYVLFDKLLALNYSEDIINKISHQNFEKMLKI